MRSVSALDPQQLTKIAAKPLLESALGLLEQGTPLPEVQALLAAAKEGEGMLGLLLDLLQSCSGTHCQSEGKSHLSSVPQARVQEAIKIGAIAVL